MLTPLKAKAEFVLTVVVRMNEFGQFVLDHTTKVKLPRVPNKARYARVLAGVGLVQLDLFGEAEGEALSEKKSAAGTGGKE